MDIDKIKQQAIEELQAEYFRAAVERYKLHLKYRNRFWNRLFPWKIIILRKDNFNV